MSPHERGGLSPAKAAAERPSSSRIVVYPFVCPPLLPPGLASPRASGAAAAACPPAGEAVAPPTWSALQLAAMMGQRHYVWLETVELVHNVAFDGKSAWVALTVTCLRADNGAHLTNVDAHVTLFYVRAELERLPTADLQHALSTARKKPQLWRCQLLFNEDYAQDGYAWCDIIVHTPLHSTLHNMVNAGIRGKPQRHFALKQARVRVTPSLTIVAPTPNMSHSFSCVCCCNAACGGLANAW